MIILSILFFVTAILYSSVGFGGGSTYLALLLIWGVPYYIFPVIALSCNIIVVSGNCINYIRAGNLNFKLLIPYLIGSIPLSFIGGSLHIDKNFFDISQRMLLELNHESETFLKFGKARRRQQKPFHLQQCSYGGHNKMKSQTLNQMYPISSLQIWHRVTHRRPQ